MSDERGYWKLVSPLPDCPKGTRGEEVGPRTWAFEKKNGVRWAEFSVDEMRRNPAIFRWVSEPKFFQCTICGEYYPDMHPHGCHYPQNPERVEWPEPKAVWVVYRSDGRTPDGVRVNTNICLSAQKTFDAIRAVLQALREGKTIYEHAGGCGYPAQAIIHPDGSKP